VAARAQDYEKVVVKFFIEMLKILPGHKPVPQRLKKKKK
jgi:hypothetical protein